MVRRLQEKLLMTLSSVSAPGAEQKVIGVFNPGACRFKDEVILLARVVLAGTREEEDRLCCLSFEKKTDGNAVIAESWRQKRGSRDAYSVVSADGWDCLKFLSYLELVRLSPDGYNIREIRHLPDLYGQTSYEEWGVEDPRITKIDDTYWISYVGVSREMSIVTCLMSTRDFCTFERHGIIFPPSNKDVVFFPEKINNKFYALHRPSLSMHTRNYAILGASSPDFVHWGQHQFVMECSADKNRFDSHRLGAGVPPIRTRLGWLHIYHGVQADEKNPGGPGIYRGGAFLTAGDEPFRVIGRCENPILEVAQDYEKKGYVDQVVFPTGAVTDLHNPDLLHIYYGCADENIAVTTLSTEEILSEIKPL